MNDNPTRNFISTGSWGLVFKTFFNLCFSVLGKLILKLLHSVFKFILSLESYSSRNLPVISVFRTSVKCDSTHDEITIKNKSFYTKTPQHLSLILGGESPSYEDFVNFIKWSIPAGISHVSFYDHHNGIDSEKLFSYICKYAKHHIPLIKWGKAFTEDIKLTSKNQINGFTWRPVVTVHIIKEDDWSSAVFESLDEISVSKSEAINVSKLDSLLRKGFQAPDPDLVIVVGSALSFFGFPPWFLRITQIQKISSHHNFSLKMFHKNLRIFSSSEQRYGK